MVNNSAEIDLLVERITDEIYRRLQNGCSLGNNRDVFGDMSKLIDHTLLKAEATQMEIKALCKEACEIGFMSVCVNSSYVPLCRELLRGSGVKLCTVVGFPLGAASTKTKVYEAKEAVENGATEIDMVIHIGAVKSGDWDYVKNDIEALAIAVADKALLKVIIETCLLTDEEKVRLCAICKLIGVDFVKTSTGMSTGGATIEDIRLMRKVVGSEIGVKASGGVRDTATAKAMI